MTRPRERLLTVIGILAGLFGGRAIVWAGFGGFNLWLILLFAIPVLLSAAGARATYTLVLAGASLMVPVQVNTVMFGIRSRHYESYGVRWEEVASTAILWAASLGVPATIALVVRHLSARRSGDHTGR
jgi:hypothetical protein